MRNVRCATGGVRRASVNAGAGRAFEGAPVQGAIERRAAAFRVARECSRTRRARTRSDVMAGSAYEGGGFSSTDGWKLGALFGVLALLSLGFTRANYSVVARLRRTHQRALRHVVEHLQQELLLLGFISLTLVALQDSLLRICVGDSSSTDGTAYCDAGKSPLWSATTLHQTHIFIFILACTHIGYVALSTTLCAWKLNSWRKWELESKDIEQLNPKINPRNASGVAQLVWRAFWAQFRFSVNREMYLSLRRLFLERTGATEDFDFHDFLRESMEEDMSSIIGMNVLMWLVATVFVMVPGALFLPAGLVCLGIMLFVGTMLESVALRLSQASYERFTDDFERPEDDQNLDAWTKRRAIRREIDSKNYFWLGRPRLMLKIFQFVLFENAISLAMLIFSLWQDKTWLVVNAQVGTGAAWVLFAVDFAVFLHSAVFILPVYAISSTVGSHCATSLQEYAAKVGITREAALQAYLTRTSSMSKQDILEAAQHDLHINEKVQLDNADAPLVIPKQPAAPMANAPLAKHRGVGAMKAAKKRLTQVTKAVVSDPFHQPDFSRENEESLTGLLGAILSKQMKEQLALQKAEQAAKDAERAASPGLLQRTMSRTLSTKNLSDSQPSAADAADEAPPANRLSLRRQDKAASPMRAVPSMKDVFSMSNVPPLASTRDSTQERTSMDSPRTSGDRPPGVRSIAELFPEQTNTDAP